MIMELNVEEQQLQYYVDSGGHCPVCCTECNYEGYHERDSTWDKHVCPKCGWSCMDYSLEDIQHTHIDPSAEEEAVWRMTL